VTSYRTVRSSAAITGVAVAALSLAACSSGGTSAGSAGTAQATGGSNAQGQTQGKDITFVPGVVGNAFYVSMECGIREAAKKYGFNVKLQGPQQFDPALQTPIVNAVTAQKPAGMIIAPDDSTAMFVPISNAAKAGIKVALVDTTLNDTSPAVTSIATDNVKGGAAAAKDLAQLIGEKGKVLVLPFKAGAATSDDRQKGFETAIKQYPNIEYIGPQYTNNDPATAASQVASTLSAHPDLAGIYATNDRSVEGAATGLRNANKIGSVKVVAFDTGPQQVQQLQQGIVQSLIGQVPREIGATAVDAIAASITGASPSRRPSPQPPSQSPRTISTPPRVKRASTRQVADFGNQRPGESIDLHHGCWVPRLEKHSSSQRTSQQVMAHQVDSPKHEKRNAPQCCERLCSTRRS
jgi:ribose transport system substrate-binding protein